jgi:thiol-disulfide isomerase/thioredoxin
MTIRIIIFAIAGLFLFSGCGKKEVKNDSLKTPAYKQLPAFKSKTSTGTEMDQTPFYSGVGIISFVASWCGPCRVEIKDLEALVAKHPNLLAIIGTYESPEFYKTLMDSLKCKLPVVRFDSSFFSALEVSNLPTRILIDKGNVVYRVEGAPTPPDTVFDNLLNKSLSASKSQAQPVK